MKDSEHLVIALDDEPAVRKSLGHLLSSHGYTARLHASGEEFFQAKRPSVPSCLLLDQELADGTTGVEVFGEMKARGWELPVIFLTAHWNVQLVVDVMRAGADGFLTKPYDPEELLKEIARALDRSRTLMRSGLLLADLQTRAASLTPSERVIVELVVAGNLNKEIADHLKLALVTVKVYRGRAMRKLQAGNAAELAHLAAMAGIVERP